MNYLLNSNICSACIKGDATVWNRFIQYSGGIALSVITVSELWTWATRAKIGQRVQRAVGEFIELVDVIDIDLQVALRFGEIRA